MFNKSIIILKQNKWIKFEFFLSILTLGLFYIFLKIFPKFKLKWFYKVTNLKDGKFLKFEGEIDLYKIKKIKFRNIKYNTFMFQKCLYTIKIDKNKNLEISSMKSPLKNKNYNQILNEVEILRSLEDLEVRKFYGNSFIDVGNKNFFVIFFKEFNNWIFYFQIFSIIVWILDDYLAYSLLILFLTLLSVISSSYEQYKNLKNLNVMANEKLTYEVKDKNNNWIEKSSFDIVVGDIIKIQENMKINNDVILINGFCYLNESNLTGESKPILKKPFNSIADNFDSKLKNNLLLSGSNVISTDLSFCEGIVYKVGYGTTKGKIIKNMLFQKDHNKNLINDSYKFLLFLLIINFFSIGFYVFDVMIINKERKLGKNQEEKTLYGHIIKILEIFTTIIPAALPLFLNECLRISKKNLEKKNIHCLNISKINQCARVNKICFDKTGTLTSEKLEVVEVFFNNTNIIDLSENDDFKSKYQNLNLKNNNYNIILKNFVINIGINNCLFQKENGEILGSSVDKTLFDLTKFKIIYNNPKLTEYKINEFFDCVFNKYIIQKIKIFEFSSKLKRMGVIAKINEKYYLFIKGAYEFIQNSLLKESIPDNLEKYINQNSQEGFRLLITCFREINEDEIENNLEELEYNMIYTGLIIFRNGLKKKTKKTITELKENDIKSIMITGDNILTAVNIAIKSNLNNEKEVFLGYKNENWEIKWKDFKGLEKELTTKDIINNIKSIDNFKIELAVESKLYHELKKSLIYEDFLALFKHIIVFSRTSPFDKEEIVSILKDINKENNLNIGFCGDGNNDCLALKKADIGLSLSTNESSLSSPFTYTKENISGMIELIIEGKNCYESSFQSFLFLIYYSFSQFVGLMILYLKYLDYSNFHYYYMDLFLCVLMSNALVSLKANKKLNNLIPHSSLFNKKIILSLIGTMIINLVVFIVADNLTNGNKNSEYYINNKRTFIFFIANTLIFFEGLSVVRTYPYKGKIKIFSEFFISILILFFFNWIIIFQPFRDPNGNMFSRYFDKFLRNNEVSLINDKLLMYYLILFLVIFISVFGLHRGLNQIYIN